MITPTGGAISGYTFNSSTYTYASVTAANSVTSVTITPTGTGTIRVNNATVVSGSASVAIPLNPGANTIAVTKQDTGKTLKTYTITITKAVAPIISLATYDASNGQLVLTGANLNTGIGIDAAKLTLVGANGSSRTLTAATTDVNPSTAATATFTVAGADKLAVDALLNKDGASSIDGTVYNLELAANWHKTAGGASDTITTVTVSNAAAISAGNGSISIGANTAQPTSLIGITNVALPINGTITIDLTPINAWGADALTTADFLASTTAAGATVTPTVAGNTLTLTVTAAPITTGSTITLTCGNGVDTWQTVNATQTLTTVRTDTGASDTFDLINTTF